MANRVCLGQRSSDIGLFISKPAVNVLTASLDNMLFSSSARAYQAVASGTVAIANNSSTTIAYPNNGYVPTVLMFPVFTGFVASLSSSDAPLLQTWVDEVTATSARLHLSFYGYTYSGSCNYVVLRLPAYG